jgi:hypothetical protein
MLVIVDEASGVLPGIWSSIHGLASSRLVVVGNPLRYDCHFRELHELASRGSSTLATVPISTLDCPDAGKEHSALGMASRSFLNQMREIHGDGSPWWQSNILGRFPGEESVRFLPAAWLDACTRGEVVEDELWKDYPEGPACMGVDVAGGVGADRSVIVVRDRKRLLEVFASEWHGVLDDARHRLEPVVAEIAKRWGIPGERIVYDKGGVGRSFESYLAQHGLGGAVGYFGSGRGGQLYTNRRTANAFAIKRRLDPHRKDHVPFYCGGIPEWTSLRQELGELRSPTMSMEEGKVKQCLEDKEQLVARLHRSPDLLDAFLMTFTFWE